MLPAPRTLQSGAEEITVEPIQTDGAVDVTIFVPCYNEAENITGTLETIDAALKVVNCRCEVIIIDDASKDASAEKVRAFQGSHPGMNLRLIVNAANRGLAGNYREAARIGAGRYIRIVCGDNVEPRDTQIAILSKLGQADMVIPYPLHVQNKTTARRLLSQTYTRIINLLSGFGLHYWNGCALLPREDVIRYFPGTGGFGFQAGLVSHLLCVGRTYVEVGCRYVERSAGTSKACTWRNLRSVAHVAIRIVLRRVGRGVMRMAHGLAGMFKGKQSTLAGAETPMVAVLQEKKAA
jgi:glycosyltransferase involved in cell wall biosynthesis